MTCAKPTFMGYVRADNQLARCTSASFSRDQKIEFYDGVYGLRDEKLGNNKGPGSGLLPQRGLMRPGVQLATTNVSFLASDLFLGAAQKGDPTNVDVALFCNENSSSLNPAYVNSYAFSCASGGVPEINVSLVGFRANISSWAPQDFQEVPIPTWRDMTVDIDTPEYNILSGSNNCIQAISFQIDNSFTPIYTAGSVRNQYQAHTLRPKIQNVTGSITLARPIDLSFFDEKVGTLSISFDGYKVDMQIIMEPGKSISGDAGSKFPISTLMFHGIDYPFE